MADAPVEACDELLPWHASLWARLQGALRAQRLPHALLLCGPPGLGKDRFAELLAGAVLCESPTADGLPCGDCRGCRMRRAGTHPDRRRCEPPEPDSPITVDQVRDISRFLSLTPHYGRHQVVLVTPAERMNQNAANSLLKTLEEPPPGGLLVLTAVRAGALPATVRSRCHRLNFAVPAPGIALDWLANRLPPDTDPELVLALANGAPLAALEIAREGHVERRRDMLEGLQHIARGRADPVAVAGEWLKFGAKESLYWMYGWLMDMARLQHTGHPPHLRNPDSREPLARMAAAVPARDLLEHLGSVSDALRLADGPANTQLLLEDVLLGWAALYGTPGKNSEKT